MLAGYLSITNRSHCLQQPVATMLQYRLYGGASLPSGLQGFMKAGANIGSVIGQFGFGEHLLFELYLSRLIVHTSRLCCGCSGTEGSLYVWFRFDYLCLTLYSADGKELMLIILATILSITTPTGSISPEGSLIYLSIFRILLGIGVGGDYPMSATITSDRANLRKRGTMLAYIFANQGWGSFVGSLVTIIVLACYKKVMEAGKTSKVDGGKYDFLKIALQETKWSIFSASLANRRWPFANSCACYSLSPSHITWVNAIWKSTASAECRGWWRDCWA